MEILKGGNASIKIIISARTLASAEGDEDTSSLLSDSSDISTMGAMFDPDDFPIGALMTMGKSYQCSVLCRSYMTQGICVADFVFMCTAIPALLFPKQAQEEPLLRRR